MFLSDELGFAAPRFRLKAPREILRNPSPPSNFCANFLDSAFLLGILLACRFNSRIFFVFVSPRRREPPPMLAWEELFFSDDSRIAFSLGLGFDPAGIKTSLLLV